jgi:hypothetical protein
MCFNSQPSSTGLNKTKKIFLHYFRDLSSLQGPHHPLYLPNGYLKKKTELMKTGYIKNHTH